MMEERESAGDERAQVVSKRRQRAVSKQVVHPQQRTLFIGLVG